MDKVKFGKRLREARLAKGLSSETLSELIGKDSGTYIRLVETGARGLSLDALIQICNALEISSDYLLSDFLKLTQDLPLETELKDKLRLLTPSDLRLLHTLAGEMIVQTRDGLR